MYMCEMSEVLEPRAEELVQESRNDQIICCLPMANKKYKTLNVSTKSFKKTRCFQVQ